MRFYGKKVAIISLPNESANNELIMIFISDNLIVVSLLQVHCNPLSLDHISSVVCGVSTHFNIQLWMYSTYLKSTVLYQGRIREEGMQLTISPTCEQKLNGRSNVTG